MYAICVVYLAFVVMMNTPILGLFIDIELLVVPLLSYGVSLSSTTLSSLNKTFYKGSNKNFGPSK